MFNNLSEIEQQYNLDLSTLSNSEKLILDIFNSKDDENYISKYEEDEFVKGKVFFIYGLYYEYVKNNRTLMKLYYHNAARCNYLLLPIPERVIDLTVTYYRIVADMHNIHVLLPLAEYYKQRNRDLYSFYLHVALSKGLDAAKHMLMQDSQLLEEYCLVNFDNNISTDSMLLEKTLSNLKSEITDYKQEEKYKVLGCKLIFIVKNSRMPSVIDVYSPIYHFNKLFNTKIGVTTAFFHLQDQKSINALMRYFYRGEISYLLKEENVSLSILDDVLNVAKEYEIEHLEYTINKLYNYYILST